ncbi:MAG: Csu type fimbrial protein [Candidatus Electronema sp. VV]
MSARLASAACTLTETTGATFSNLSSGSSQIASLSVTCDSEYRLALDAGAWSSGSRRLQDGKGDFITYRFWQDKSAAQEWGDNGASYAAPPLNAAAGSNTHSVFGSLSADAASAPPGDYSDTVRIMLAWPPYGTADQQSATLSVALHVTETCSMDVSGIHGFGTWPTGGSNPSGVALGSISVTCSPGIQYALGVDAGQHYDGSRRQLASGSSMVPYILRTSSSGPEWGDTGLKAIISDYIETHHAQAVQGGGTGQSQNFFLWGDAETAGAPDGNYADTVTVTITW